MGLPNSNDITKQYCTRFCGILVVDGKYISIKGYERKIPLLWGLDYLTHDIPVFRLAPSESYEAWLKYFGYLKSIKYPLQIVICDDNENIKLAARFMFPNVLVQLCQNHFLENIRKDLSVRTEEKYRPFVQDLKRELFSRKLTRADFQGKAFRLVKKYEKEIVPMQVLRKIHDNLQELTAASLVKTAPLTTNIIESFNSHLQARLKSIKKFQSFHSAGLWLNAYILRRRYKPFTDCGKKFKYLNHKSAISQTCRKNAVLPLFTM